MMEEKANKSHRTPKAGPKAEKKKQKLAKEDPNHAKSLEAKGRNPKAFALNNPNAARRSFQRKAEVLQKKMHNPMMVPISDTPPPFIIAVVGPPKVGKTTLIRSLVKHYTKHNLKEVKGPITLVSGKNRRLTFFECGNDMVSMIDIAKVADLVLLMVDASFGFEMETFEFLNVLQVHGFPRVMGVLTHLDLFKKPNLIKKVKKKLKDRFWTEIYDGAKLFYLSGMIRDRYPNTEVKNLARFISVLNFRPLTWRVSHSSVLVDRLEDLTDVEEKKRNPKCDRKTAFYGYVRGTNLKPDTKVHIPGTGDFFMSNVSALPDPCPLPSSVRKKLNEKQKAIYAPMSDVGNIFFDQDAIYVDVGQKQQQPKPEEEEEGVGEKMLKLLQTSATTIDSSLQSSQMKLFKQGEFLKNDQVVFDLEDDEEEDDEDDEEEKPPQHPLQSFSISGERKRRAAPEGMRQSHNYGKAEKEDDEDLGQDDDEDEDDDQETFRIEKNGDDDFDEEEDLEDLEDGDLEDGDLEGEEDEEGEDEDEGEEDEEGEEEEEGEELPEGFMSVQSSGQQWRKNLGENVERPQSLSLMDLVYSDRSKPFHSENGIESNSRNDEDDMDSFFKPKKQAQAQQIDSSKSFLLSTLSTSTSFNFSAEQVEKLMSRFSKVGEAEKEGMEKEAEELYGDFEDLEEEDESKKKPTAPQPEKPKQIENKKEEENDKPLTADEIERQRRRNLDDKKNLKEKFDTEYDAEEEPSFFEQLKEKVTKEAEESRKEFQNLDPSQRLLLEGFPIGTYVRIEISNIPYQFAEHFDAYKPLLVGAIHSTEEKLAFIQVRFKKHRWYRKILKSNDPLIFSIGWRRFQSLPVYSVKDPNERNRYLKYTPEHMHCVATLFGPVNPPNTGVAAFQTLSNELPFFRVSATGVVLELDQSFQLMKKLKLTGTAAKIFRNTAFIKDMFTSSLEVAKFVGAKIRTVSGIRGQIKKALKKPEGSYRATFEDRILASDIVFLRSWAPVKMSRYYNPITSHLVSTEDWPMMKTIYQLRQDSNAKIPVKKDSEYKNIVRQPKKFNPLRISKNLLADLPFASKPKLPKKRAHPTLKQRRAVVLEPEEQKMRDLMTQLRTIRRNQTEHKTLQAKRDKKAYTEKKAVEEAEAAERLKKRRREVFKKEGLEAERAAKRQKRGKRDADD